MCPLLPGAQCQRLTVRADVHESGCLCISAGLEHPLGKPAGPGLKAKCQCRSRQELRLCSQDCARLLRSDRGF